MTIYDPPPADMGDDGVYQGTQGCQGLFEVSCRRDPSSHSESDRCVPGIPQCIPTTPDIPALECKFYLVIRQDVKHETLKTAQHPSASSTTSSYKRAITEPRSLCHSPYSILPLAPHKYL